MTAPTPPMGCQAKSGFFTLRSCGGAPVARCTMCGREVCAAHLAGGPRAARCLDCDARARDESQAPWNQTGRSWVYRYRRAQSGRYHEDVDDYYYDDFDVGLWNVAQYQVFEQIRAEDAAGYDDDDGEWSFGDS